MKNHQNNKMRCETHISFLYNNVICYIYNMSKRKTLTEFINESKKKNRYMGINMITQKHSI